MKCFNPLATSEYLQDETTGEKYLTEPQMVSMSAATFSVSAPIDYDYNHDFWCIATGRFTGMRFPKGSANEYKIEFDTVKVISYYADGAITLSLEQFKDGHTNLFDALTQAANNLFEKNWQDIAEAQRDE